MASLGGMDSLGEMGGLARPDAILVVKNRQNARRKNEKKTTNQRRKKTIETKSGMK